MRASHQLKTSTDASRPAKLWMRGATAGWRRVFRGAVKTALPTDISTQRPPVRGAVQRGASKRRRAASPKSLGWSHPCQA
jgi:hypothetical protein